MSKWGDWLTEPENSTRLHLWSAVAWFVIGTPVTLIWLANSVAFVAWMSLYAIVLAHVSGYQGAHAELRVKEDEDK